MTGPRPLPGLLDIAPYVPGKHGGASDLKMSANESALGPSPKALVAYRNAAETIHRYPDGAARALKEAIADTYDLDVARIVVGTGSDEIIQLLIRAYAEPGANIVQSVHGFSYYHTAAEAVRVGTRYAAEARLTADPAAMVGEVDGMTRLMFLANPNNPTGTLLSRRAVRELRRDLRQDVMLVLDGAYAEYVTAADYTPGADLVDEAEAEGRSDTVMTRTFSKIYGLGGLRIGWGYMPSAVADVLERIRPPFNVSGPALAAATAAVRDQAFVVENRDFTTAERKRVSTRLESLGYDVVPAHANFVCFAPEGGRRPDRTGDLLTCLERGGVVIRSCGSSGLPGWARVTIGLAHENDRFLDLAESFATT